jgi:hypothetical protein
MDKHKIRGWNLGRIFNYRCVRTCVCHVITHITKQPDLMFKNLPKQLLGPRPLAFALPGQWQNEVLYSSKLPASTSLQFFIDLATPSSDWFYFKQFVEIADTGGMEKGRRRKTTDVLVVLSDSILGNVDFESKLERQLHAFVMNLCYWQRGKIS